MCSQSPLHIHKGGIRTWQRVAITSLRLTRFLVRRFQAHRISPPNAVAIGMKRPIPSASFWEQLAMNCSALFWLLLGGFMWVMGTSFSNMLSSTSALAASFLFQANQLWGLLWGILAFSELRGGSRTIYAEVIGGSIIIGLGACAVAVSSATEREHRSWRAVLRIPPR